MPCQDVARGKGDIAAQEVPYTVSRTARCKAIFTTYRDLTCKKAFSAREARDVSSGFVDFGVMSRVRLRVA